MRALVVNAAVAVVVAFVTASLVTPGSVVAQARQSLFGDSLHVGGASGNRAALTYAVESPSGRSTGYGLFLSNPGQKEQVKLVVDDDGGASLIFLDSAGQLRVAIGVTPDGTPTLIMIDANGLAWAGPPCVRGLTKFNVFSNTCDPV